jgi:hypothetical protein
MNNKTNKTKIIEVLFDHPEWSLRQIGREVGVSHEWVRQVLIKAGRKTSPPTPSAIKLPCEVCAKLFKRAPSRAAQSEHHFCCRACEYRWKQMRHTADLYESGLSSPQIAGRVGVTDSTVRAWIAKVGVELRSPGDAEQLRSDGGDLTFQRPECCGRPMRRYRKYRGEQMWYCPVCERYYTPGTRPKRTKHDPQ